MDRLRGRYRDLATNSVVLDESMVAAALQRPEPRDDGLNAFRGGVNALLISLLIWGLIGVAIYTFA